MLIVMSKSEVSIKRLGNKSKKKLTNQFVRQKFSRLLSFKSWLFTLSVTGLTAGMLMSSAVLVMTTRAAASIFWVGSAGGGDNASWADPLNWSEGRLPNETDDVLVDATTTVQLTAPVTINSLTLGNISGTNTPTLNFNYNALESGPLTLSNGDLVVHFGAIITHQVGTTVPVGTMSINIQNGDADINGSINTEGKGYTRGQGPGKGIAGGFINTEGSGAGHGGYGGDSSGGILGGGSYGSIVNPVTIGSGASGYHNTGGYGGGAVKLVVAGTLTVNGTISAKGGDGDVYGGTYGGGGGSGGSIWIVATSLLGDAGNIIADGGNAGGNNVKGGGGGGGRVALYYNSKEPSLGISANGGRPVAPAQHGGAGTVYLKPADQAASLILNLTPTTWTFTKETLAITPIEEELTLEQLTVSNYANVENLSTMIVNQAAEITTKSFFTNKAAFSTTALNIIGSTVFNESSGSIVHGELNWSGADPVMLVDNGGAMFNSSQDLVVPTNATFISNSPHTFSSITIDGTVTHAVNDTEQVSKVNLTAYGNITINSGGVINVDEKGYLKGEGPGQGVDSDLGGSGAGYGGIGGSGSNGDDGGTTYGFDHSPNQLGSGGGNYNNSGGNGGGAVILNAGGLTTINGMISANGGAGALSDTVSGGGGSGGSIWINTNSLAGDGVLRANGGSAVDATTDGGGGGGGRIALYYSSDTSVLNTLSADGGGAGDTAQPGQAGSIYYEGVPSKPFNMKQFKVDGTTAISQGGKTNETSIVVTFQSQDGDETDVLTPELEIQPVGTSFNDVATHTGNTLSYEGSPVTAEFSISSLADGTHYHWQARVCDADSHCSSWTSFGNNTEDEADVMVNLNNPPNVPSIPESSFYINGQYTNITQPTIGFVLSDSDFLDTVKFRIQLADNSSFSSPIIDYTSDLRAQGTSEFVIGQQAGEGVYTVGAAGQTLSSGNFYWRVLTIDENDNLSSWTTATGTPAFRVDRNLPTNASGVSMKAHAAAAAAYTEEDERQWFSRNDLYFSWNEGTDTEGVKGYCLYLDTDEAGNPATQKGLLGTSPISTTGTTCEFITDQTEIDFSSSSLRSYDWLTSSDQPYYFKVKTIDIANNTFVGSDDSNFVSFYFDKTAPTAVTTISAPSVTLSNAADMYFNWPTAGSQAASDVHSGLLGFQYALNTTDTWYGSLTDEKTGFDYYLLSEQQPFYMPAEVQSLAQLGQNIIYFRVLDKAGNVSELRTAAINYGGEAPNFAQGDAVIALPSQNTENEFSFTWPAASSETSTIATYYYMINTPPPVSYATITSNSATYIATSDTFIANTSFSGLRKGANTIYVIAVDEDGNYASTNNISTTFYLNTEAPDPPESLAAVDGSIKDASLWRASIIWNEPEYKGTGDLTYHIERSEDGETWTEVATTTGLAYIDTVPESKLYYWRVSSTDNSDESINNPSYANAVSLVPRGKYLEPANLTSGPATSSITTTRATLSWTTDRNSDSKLAYGLGSGNYFDSLNYQSEQTTEHSLELENLKPGTKYYYKAQWTDEDGNTGESDEDTFTTEPPPEVKEVGLSNVGVSSAIINFTTKNATSAKIYYGTTNDFGGAKTIGTSKLETSYSVELDQLDDGTKYYYKINTFDEEEAEYEGTTLDFTTMPRPEVSNIQVEQITNTAQSAMSVTWTSNTEVSSIVTFYPEDRPELARDQVDVKLSKGKHSMVVKGLFPDTTYVIRVSGRDVIGNEAVSENITITTSSDTRPPQITDVKVEGTNLEIARSQDNPSQLIISWTTDEPATSQVEYGEGSGDTFSQLSQEDVNLSLNHMVIIPNLSPSKVYHLRAISKDGAGNESKSVNTVTITPRATDSAFDLVITNLREAFGFLDGIVE